MLKSLQVFPKISKNIQIYTNSFSKIVPIFLSKNWQNLLGKKKEKKNLFWEKELELKNCNFMWELVWRTNNGG